MAGESPELLRDMPQGVVTTTPPQSKLSPGQIAQPYEELGNALDKLGGATMDVASAYAERQGSQAVTRDAQGNIQVEPPPMIFGAAGQAYERTMREGVLAEADGQFKRADIELRQKYRDDPQGYQAAADAYKQQSVADITKAAGPQVGMAVGRAIDTTTTQTYRGLLNEKERLDLERTDSSQKAVMQGARDDLMVMARGGVDPNSPDFVKALDAYRGTLAARVANPRMSYSQDQANLEVNNLMGDLSSQRYLHGINDTYKNQGAQAAEQAAQNILTDKSITLPETERLRYYHEAVGEVRANEAIRHQNVYEARVAWAEIKEASVVGEPLDPETVQKGIDAFTAAGDYAGAAAAGAYASHMKLNDSYGRQSLGDMDRQLFDLQRKAATVQPNGFMPALARTLHEEGSALVTDVNGAPVKYGINAAFNPGEDVANMTQDRAAQIYKKNYWDAIGGDDLAKNNPALAHVAFDAAVISGPDKAKQWLAQSGGDPNKFMDLREAFQAQLLRDNPEKYGRAANAWAQRNANLRGDIAASSPVSNLGPAGASGGFFLGDSIADGLRGAARAPGNTVQGRTPAMVQNAIASTDPRELVGKPIFLSTGLSNAHGESDWKSVQSQIDTLKTMGVDASQIHLIGVGDRADFAGINDRLAQVAKANGAIFTGPLDPKNLRRNAADNSDNGVHAANWNQELSRITGGGSGGVTPASSMWELKNRETELDKGLWTSWKQVMKDYDETHTMPARDVVETIRKGAYDANNGALQSQMAHDLDRMDYVSAAGRLPIGQQTQQVEQLKGLGAAGQLQPWQGDLLKDLDQTRQAIMKGLQDKPIETTVEKFGDRFNAPMPLDFTHPDNLNAGLQQRATIAKFAQQNWQTGGAVSALDDNEIVQAKAALSNPDPMVKAGIYGALANLPPDVRAVTLAKIGGGEPKGMAEAAAGSMMKDNAPLAASIFRGMAAMQDKNGDHWDPEKQGPGSSESYRADLDKALPSTIFDIQNRTLPGGAYSTMATMVKARYADLAAQAGDSTYNGNRLDQAVNDVTGGVVYQNGGAVIAPKRGMTQMQFDRVMTGVSDSDLAGVMTPSGEKITADYLKSNAQLESASDGKYFVRLNKDPDHPLYAYQQPQAPPQGDGQWRKFQLDLTNRTPGPMPPMPMYTGQ